MSRSRLLVALAAIGPCLTGPTRSSGSTITGTWGGDNAGLIASDSTAHVHIGCTLGDASGPIHPDAAGHFEVAGLYDVDAYPVARGILHPARFFGEISERTMVLTVALTDTARQLGPVTLTYGKEPRMQACPICRVPKPRRE
jgi:hypothetical protein